LRKNNVKFLINFQSQKLGTQISNISHTLGLKIRKTNFKEMPLIKGFFNSMYQELASIFLKNI
jgi:hypothetical protein